MSKNPMGLELDEASRLRAQLEAERKVSRALALTLKLVKDACPIPEYFDRAEEALGLYNNTRKVDTRHSRNGCEEDRS